MTVNYDLPLVCITPLSVSLSSDHLLRTEGQVTFPPGLAAVAGHTLTAAVMSISRCHFHCLLTSLRTDKTSEEMGRKEYVN